jgi:restriction endonuclease S subunit
MSKKLLVWEPDQRLNRDDVLIETLKKVEVPCPSKDEQIRIATLLSHVEALIDTRKENLRLAG